MSQNDQPLTKKDFLNGLHDFWEKIIKPELDKMATKDDLKKEVIRLETGQREIKRKLTDLELDTPTKREFDNLKNRVDVHHPIN